VCSQNSSPSLRKDSLNPDSAITSLRILLVDDEPLILKYMAQALTCMGHRVLPMCGCSVEDANRILRDATELAFDLAIVDTIILVQIKNLRS
jgi:DNA-binding response OmpR family regulator